MGVRQSDTEYSDGLGRRHACHGGMLMVGSWGLGGCFGPAFGSDLPDIATLSLPHSAQCPLTGIEAPWVEMPLLFVHANTGIAALSHCRPPRTVVSAS